MQMNRRGFIGSLLAVGAGFTILPGATTYTRKWVFENGIWRKYPSTVIPFYGPLMMGTLGPVHALRYYHQPGKFEPVGRYFYKAPYILGYELLGKSGEVLRRNVLESLKTSTEVIGQLNDEGPFRLG